jgi:hypothetical protein
MKTCEISCYLLILLFHSRAPILHDDKVIVRAIIIISSCRIFGKPKVFANWTIVIFSYKSHKRKSQPIGSPKMERHLQAEIWSQTWRLVLVFHVCEERSKSGCTQAKFSPRSGIFLCLVISRVELIRKDKTQCFTG